MAATTHGKGLQVAQLIERKGKGEWERERGGMVEGAATKQDGDVDVIGEKAARLKSVVSLVKKS